jgi:enediyne biosynthesis protein E4
VKRRSLLGSALGYLGCPLLSLPASSSATELGFSLADVTTAAGIDFRHNSGAFGAKYLPETMGPGCAFLDYDGDGWLDILLVNGMDWPSHKRQRSTLKLYRNNRNGTFSDVTERAGLAVEMYGMGVAVADFNNDGFADILITAVGQNRLFQNTGAGHFVDVTEKAGLGGRTGFSTAALWFDFDRDGFLDLLICNYVKWSPQLDVFCSVDGKRKSYCTPEAYHGDTCWLFRNRGNGTFEDVTAKSGIFDPTSKSLGVALLDYDRDGWPDVVIANDTQPNKLYRNLRNGGFEDVAVRVGVAFSEDGKARAGMGIDAADFDNSGMEGIAITNFDSEMMALYRASRAGVYTDVAIAAGVGQASRASLGFGCAFLDVNLDGRLDLVAVNGHIDETVRQIRGNAGYAQPPHLFLNRGAAGFQDVASLAGGGFAAPKVARGLAYGDFDRDGDPDLLITTNQGEAHLYRNDVAPGAHWLRLRLIGTKSNRDAIGAVVRLTTP